MSIWDNDYIKLLRVNHWFKNLFILVGAFAALLYADIELNQILFLKLFFSFLLASIVSSANYIINQITDAEFDIKHPQKKNRPIPSGKVSKEISFFFLIALFLLAFFISLKYFYFNFSFMIFVFWLAGIFYNVKPIRLKDVPFIDVISESANNPIRFLLGWFTILPNSFPPLIFLSVSWTMGAFLMTAKRYDEILNFGKDLVPYRNTFRAYTLNKLRFFLATYLITSIMLVVLVILNFNTKYLYGTPFLFIYSIWLYLKIVSGKAKAHNIEEFVLTKGSLFFSSLIFLVFLFIFKFL